jgi:glycosyltransferase involved in cell wall biosynthesis
LSIIVPVYNEEKRMRACLERMVEFSRSVDWEFEVIIADDGSTDMTAEIVREYEIDNKFLKLISWQERQGKGASIKKVALLSFKDHVCYMDVDLAADPSELGSLLKFKDEYDVIIGSRLLPGERRHKIERPINRSFFSKSYSLAFRTLFRAQYYDPQCGFKLFRRDALVRILDNVNNNAFAFDSEVVIKALLLGYKVKEIPINWKHIEGSKIKVFHQVVSMGKDLISIWDDAYRFQLQSETTSPGKNYVDKSNNLRKMCRGELLLRMRERVKTDSGKTHRIYTPIRSTE